MKKFARILSLVMIMAIILSATAILASAADNGTIKLTNPKEGITYKLYRVLDLQTYDKDLGAYLYTVASGWENFFAAGQSGLTYVKKTNINGTDYIEWNTDNNAETIEKFAKDALAYAVANNVAIVATYTGTGTETDGHTFTGLPLGYYLLDSSLGALCSLTTTDPDATITEKNDTHTIDKVVKEDSTDTWGKEATYQIGDVVPYKLTVTIKKGAESLVVHDMMEAGLTLNQNSFAVKVSGADLASTNYTIDFSPAEHGGKQCTFHISFTQAYLDTISADTEVVIEYSAVVNKNAELHTNSNDNTSWLTAGNDFYTEETTVKVMTFLFDLVKIDGSGKMLAGAKFELYDALTGGNKIPLVKINDNEFRVATEADKADPNFQSAEMVTNDKPIRVLGLDADSQTTYYLAETEAPAGYNILVERVPVKLMTEGTNPAPTNLPATPNSEKPSGYDGGVQVTNKTGAVLPETGGIGTSLFLAFGSMTALCAAVVLVARKKAAAYR